MLVLLVTASPPRTRATGLTRRSVISPACWRRRSPPWRWPACGLSDGDTSHVHSEQIQRSDDRPQGRARDPGLIRRSRGRRRRTSAGGPSSTPPKCIGCAGCANNCPAREILVFDVCQEIRILKYLGRRCTYCGRCADVCPEKAITMSRDSRRPPTKSATSGSGWTCS